jgi:osmotically-inducible protein OsmY
MRMSGANGAHRIVGYERQYRGGVRSYYGGFGGFSGEGRHAERGPKNWQCSDERIKEDVNERLTDHRQIDATEIDIRFAAVK